MPTDNPFQSTVEVHRPPPRREWRGALRVGAVIAILATLAAAILLLVASLFAS